MADRKAVTVSVTLEVVMEVDAEAWEAVQRLDDSAKARALAAHPTTKIGELVPECAQILNVEDADA